MIKLWWEASSVILEKAFDSIHHDIVISKLDFYDLNHILIIDTKGLLLLGMSTAKNITQPRKG